MICSKFGLGQNSHIPQFSSLDQSIQPLAKCRINLRYRSYIDGELIVYFRDPHSLESYGTIDHFNWPLIEFRYKISRITFFLFIPASRIMALFGVHSSFRLVNQTGRMKHSISISLLLLNRIQVN